MPSVDDIASVIASGARHRVLVAVDGGDGSGKTTYAAALSAALHRLGRAALVIHVDDFMHVPAVRHRRGRTSPEGYLDDSYDYDALTRCVLEPLSTSDDPDTITIVEGLFLLRDELAHWWDHSIFLDVPLDVALGRKSVSDGVTLSPDSPLTRRYVEGQLAYRTRHRPLDRATWVVRPGA